MRTRTFETDVTDGRDTDWHRFLVAIDDVISSGSFTWALPTLEGIRRVVEQQGRVTPEQRQALGNIVNNLWPRRRI